MTFGERLEYNKKIEEKKNEIAKELDKLLKDGSNVSKYCEKLEEYYSLKYVNLFE